MKKIVLLLAVISIFFIYPFNVSATSGSSDLKILSVSSQPAMYAGKFDLAVYYQGPTDSDFVPFKIRLTNKKDGKVYYANVISAVQKNVDFIIPYGSYQGEIMIDSDENIAESDESNNLFIKDFAYCGANQTANCGGSSSAADLKVSSKDDYYGGQNRTYSGDVKSIVLMNVNFLSPDGNVTLESLSFAPFNHDDYLANLVNIRLLKNGQEIALLDKTYAAAYWPDKSLPKVPGYIDFKNINLPIPSNESVDLSLTAELGKPVTEIASGFSYSLNVVTAKKSDGSKINYSSGSQDEAGRGNLPIKGLNIIIKPVADGVATPTTSPIIINTSSTTTSTIATSTNKNTTTNVKPETSSVDKDLSKRLKGRIMLQVESRGEAWYINPKDEKRYYMADGNSAYSVMRNFGIGISNQDLNKIPVSKDYINSLPDLDSDKDGYNDKQELKNGYNPYGVGKLVTDQKFTAKNYGKIFLQVESRGEAWYVSPSDGLRYYLGAPADAFSIMRSLGIGITNNDLNKIVPEDK